MPTSCRDSCGSTACYRSRAFTRATNQFDGSEPEDIENYTNHAPYHIQHPLCEASIDRAVEAFPDAVEIYERNQTTLAGMDDGGGGQDGRPELGN